MPGALRKADEPIQGEPGVQGRSALCMYFHGVASSSPPPAKGVEVVPHVGIGRRGDLERAVFPEVPAGFHEIGANGLPPLLHLPLIVDFLDPAGWRIRLASHPSGLRRLEEHDLQRFGPSENARKRWLRPDLGSAPEGNAEHRHETGSVDHDISSAS
jgi:hypothetical protein